MTKPIYERPVLIRHAVGMMNKFSQVQGMKALTQIDGVPISELVAQYGSPLFVFSEKTMVRRYRELRDVLALRYPKVREILTDWSNMWHGVLDQIVRRRLAIPSKALQMHRGVRH